MTTDPRESWPEQFDDVFVEHVTLEIGAVKVGDEWRPSVTLDLYARDTAKPTTKRSVRLRLDGDTAEALGRMLPEAAADARTKLGARQDEGSI